MGTISSYPAASMPLDGTENLAADQNGAQVRVPLSTVSDIAASAAAGALASAIQEQLTPVVAQVDTARNAAAASATQTAALADQLRSDFGATGDAETIGRQVALDGNGTTFGSPSTLVIGQATGASEIASIALWIAQLGQGSLTLVELSGAAPALQVIASYPLAAPTAVGLAIWSLAAGNLPTIRTTAGSWLAIGIAGGGYQLVYGPQNGAELLFLNEALTSGTTAFNVAAGQQLHATVTTQAAITLPHSALNAADAASLDLVAARTAGQNASGGYAGALGEGGNAFGGPLTMTIGVVPDDSDIETVSAWIEQLGSGDLALVLLAGAAPNFTVVEYRPVPVGATGAVTWTAGVDFAPLRSGTAQTLGLASMNGGVTLLYAPTTGTNLYYANAVTTNGAVQMSTAANNALKASFTTSQRFTVDADDLGADVLAVVVETAAASAGTHSAPKVALTPALAPARADWSGLVYYGESLSSGVMYPLAGSVVSTAQPYANLTFSGGPKAGKAGNTYGAGNTNPGTSSVKALVEDTLNGADNNGNQGETMCSGAAAGAVEAAAALGIAPAAFVIMASTAGHGGYTFANLRKGATWYGNLLDHVSEAKARATAAGKGYTLPAVLLVLGHNDASAGTTRAAYLAALLQFVSDINVDLPAITGQTTPVHVLMSQLGTMAATTGGSIQLAQMDAVAASPLIHLTGAKWHLPYTPDSTHLVALGYQIAGHVDGRAYSQLVVEGRVPDCIWPVSVIITGSTITARFRVPRAPLVFDTDSFPATRQMGFRLTDAAGDIPLIGLRASGNAVTATLGRATTNAAAPQLRFALDYLAPGRSLTGGATGNLRDSTADTYQQAGAPIALPHVCPAFAMAAAVLGQAS